MRRALLNANDYAVYAYDHAGQRARKVVKKGQNVEERRYVAGWEVWRKTVSGTLDEERTTLHVMDGERRIAMVETKTVSGGSVVGSPVARVRYQLDNHLGTSILELTESGGIISYEEYHPYGTCAWWAGDASVDVSRRRYRYTGMERDEETGLQYHSARYYAAWLGRWERSDPIGLQGGVNRFAYVENRPIVSIDVAGAVGMLVTGGVGAALGGAVGAGVAFYQQRNDAAWDWRRIAATAAGGAVAGGLAGLTGGSSLVAGGGLTGGAALVTGEAGAAVAGGTVTRSLLGVETTRADVATDAFVGVATLGLLKGGEKVVGSAVKAFVAGNREAAMTAVREGGAEIFAEAQATIARAEVDAGAASVDQLTEQAISGTRAELREAVEAIVAPNLGVPLANDAIVVFGSTPKPTAFKLRPGVDTKPVAGVNARGKSVSEAVSLELADEFAVMFGSERAAALQRGDTLSGAFVEDIRAAGFDVVSAPTATNPHHARLVEVTGSFDDPEALEMLSIAFDRLQRVK
jgi:RHS repeat-associated protein